ncbi:MAG: response regulator [Gammaproteobacteria bacterium]|nr:response regulator [Gammaproteobacteria bacterium]
MKYLIIDRDAKDRRKLKKILLKMNPRGVILESTSGSDAIRLFRFHQPEVILTETDLGDMSGFEVSLHCSSAPYFSSTILTTSNGKQALEAFDSDAIDYLVKPIQPERLERALQKATWFSKNRFTESGMAENRSHIAVSMKGKVKLVPLQEICYFKAENKYIVVKTATETYYMNETLNNIERDLGDEFIRAHRNALISVRHIDGLEKTEDELWYVLFKNIDDRLQISRRQKPSIRRCLRKCS